jgi:dTDP-4-dehydrorhamnose 3,5-epimerase
MNIEPTKFSGAYIINTSPFIDIRGKFARFFCQQELSTVLGKREILNINFSSTEKKGTMRGLHYQRPPGAEMKLARCIRGSVFDVIVDVRKNSPTFLQWFGTELSAENMKMILIPEGFAHGFQSLENSVEMLYLHTAFYSQECEDALNCKDPTLNIAWPLEMTEISEKDNNHPFINSDFMGVKL